MEVITYLKKEIEKSLNKSNDLSKELFQLESKIERNRLNYELYVNNFKLNSFDLEVEYGKTLEYYNRREDAKIKSNEILKTIASQIKQKYEIKLSIETEISNYISCKKRLSWFTGEEYE